MFGYKTMKKMGNSILDEFNNNDKLKYFEEHSLSKSLSDQEPISLAQLHQVMNTLQLNKSYFYIITF